MSHILTKDCCQIQDPNQLIEYLALQGRDAFEDWDYQLQTNYGFVHLLANGEVAFFDNHFKHPAILFADKMFFDECIKSEKFPVDNPEQGLFDFENDRTRSFHLQANYYREHLNTVLKFDFPVITKEAAQAYLKKVIGRKIKGITTATDVIALISVIGELVKAETSGKWFLIKSYGTYNPTYEPNILTLEGNVYLMSSRIISKIKWRTSRLEDIFNDVHSKITAPIEWKKFSENRSDLILLE